ncbi:hypothetical protein CA265_22255 [Sphingobacteriaceae bacterium GW460-11-11-14-LB5]|nr:hypothetical protein CA265_22255 [Sphingobacteriaceae bacterium GW460-11-11-14-LB5]
MGHEKLIQKFKKQIKDLKTEAFTEASLKKVFDDIIRYIDEDVKDKAFDRLASNLTMGLGVHAGDYPKHLILNGDKDGWKYITRYLLWQDHILYKLFNYKEVSSRSVGCIIALATIWKMEKLAQLSRDYFQLLFNQDKKSYTHDETHHLFVATLFDLYSTKSINQDFYDTLPKEHVYKKFLDHWNTENLEVLATIIFDICDMHIYSALDLKDKFSEILSLDLIPYEIRLIQVLREQNGLAMPKVSHPLLETPLAEIPAEKPEWDLSKDQVFQYLISKEKAD